MMKQSQLFTKARKESPKDEQARNADLLIRAGYIYKEMAGVYAYLPLGLRVLENIAQIIREEMNAIGGQEVQLTVLQNKQTWETTNRWSDEVVDVWMKSKLANGSEIGLGFTHEEPLTSLMKDYLRSYKDLPCYVYQIQTKFRNEARAKSGLLRGREFLMKDLYSFSRSQVEHDAFYQQAQQAYMNVFKRVGLGEVTYMTFASGGTFSKYSHEFQTITDAGEDTIYIAEEQKIAINKEVLTDEVCAELGVEKGALVEKTAAEVGNIFSLGTKFSEPLQLTYTDEQGATHPVIMGSYGIGLGRLMGTVVEVHNDERGIIWPETIAPYGAHVLTLDNDLAQISVGAIETLESAGISVLWDDRYDIRPGERFAEADLIGIPWRIIISKKNDGKYEITNRKTGKTQIVESAQLLSTIQN